jgi:hypothetical protein
VRISQNPKLVRINDRRGDVVSDNELDDLYRAQQHIAKGQTEVAKKAAQIAKRIRSGAVTGNRFDFDLQTNIVRPVRRRSLKRG